MHEIITLHLLRPDLWQVRGATNGYLLVRGDASLLIDCPAAEVAPALREAGLPLPATVCHTHVQEEHCREWDGFAGAAVYVPAGSDEVARRTDAYFSACATVWPPDRQWDTLGAEPYGIAGCPTERPPQMPLAVTGALAPDTPFTWQDITFDIIPLPGHGKHAIGLYWRDAGLLFSGDLLRAGGYLVNFYDLERSYGHPTGYRELLRSLQRVQTLAPAALLPATGPLIDHPAADCAALRARLDARFNLPSRRAETPPAITNFAPRREFGRYREVLPGLYQNTNYGNVILYVDAEGRGCLVDPDICVWESWEANCRAMHADLDLLERETGLRRIELALITHYHGDHVQYANLLRARYGTEIATTPDIARVLETPAHFRYPCVLDWYGFPFDHLCVDRRLVYEEVFRWHDVPITPLHLPGHCYAHAGYAIPWQGQQTVCAGDVLQYGAGPIGVGLPVLYNDTAWPDRGILVSLRRIAAAAPDWVLGGHSHAFHEDGAILTDWIAATEDALGATRNLSPDGDLLCAMTPPGYDAKRPAIAASCDVV